MNDEIQDQIEKLLAADRARFSSWLRVLKAILLAVALLFLGGLGFFFYSAGSDSIDFLWRPQFYVFLVVLILAGVGIEFLKQRVLRKNSEEERASIAVIFDGLNLAVFVILGFLFGYWYTG